MTILRIGFFLVATVSLSTADNNNLKNDGKFPKKFMFGAATAAYQIEGAWNVDGRGESTWDRFVHSRPSQIAGNGTGDIACNSYYKYKEDVRLAASLGLQFYRISISWTRYLTNTNVSKSLVYDKYKTGPRTLPCGTPAFHDLDDYLQDGCQSPRNTRDLPSLIFPNGYTDYVNHKGLKYYHNLIEEIRSYGMTPLVTIFHWDHPQKLMDDGLSWTNPDVIDVFVEYARFIIKSFPQVGYWITINEPRVFCMMSYGIGVHAPGVKGTGISDYQCSYVVLKAHAAVYHMYKREFPHYKAPMSIVIDCQWYEPETNELEDVEAANRQLQFECGTYFHPIFNGDWPPLVKARVAERSCWEGYPRSRLPEFTHHEIQFIKGTYDFLATNHYFTFLASDEEEAPCNETEFENDVRTVNSRNPNWEVGSNQWAIVPWGARKLLNWLTKQYGHQNILITEIGVADDGTSLEDDERIDFYSDYYCEILEAMQIDKINVFGIAAWSLLDNFEWASGYTMHFGLFQIDFNRDRYLTRRAKKSVSFYRQMIASRQLQCSSYNREWGDPSWGPDGKRNRNYYRENGGRYIN